MKLLPPLALVTLTLVVPCVIANTTSSNTLNTETPSNKQTTGGAGQEEPDERPSTNITSSESLATTTTSSLTTVSNTSSDGNELVSKRHNNKDRAIRLTSDEAIMIIGSGIALFCVMYVSLFIPIDKSGPRVLCILIPMNLSLMFSRRMRRRGPEYDTSLNQPCDIFFFVIFWFGAMHFMEYLVAFTSIAKITNEINRDREALEVFVYSQDEVCDAADQSTGQSVGENSEGESGNPAKVVVSNPKVPKEIVVPAALPSAMSLTLKNEIRVPKSMDSGAPTTIKVPSFEAPPLRKKFRTRSVRHADGTEHTETEILPALSESDGEESGSTGSKKSNSRETLPINQEDEMDLVEDEKGVITDRRSRRSWETISVQADGTRRIRPRKKSDEDEVQPIISYVPADVSARKYYLWTFVFILYIFCVIYIL